MSALTSVVPLSLYVHLPWCKAKCPYCDFNSHVAQEIPYERYVDALLMDLERELPRVWGRMVHSIFLGGGTPSLFPPEAIERLLSGIRARLRLFPGCEISMEANPGAVDAAAFAGYFAAGVNRLSLGVQSFQDGFLRVLGRIHDGRAALEAIDSLQQAGFRNWNLDLIFALPGQSLSQALADLQQALALDPPHLSLYQLTLEPGTPFARQAPRNIPDLDASAEMEEVLREHLALRGLARYEISAHARQGSACWHNRNYWLYGDYLGIGAGAHGKLTIPGEGILRTRKPPRPESYLTDALGPREQLGELQWVQPTERPFEFFLNALRLVEGFHRELFEARTGISFVLVEGKLRRLEQEGFLERVGEVWRPTPRGLDWHNYLCRLFLPEAAEA
ncbi:MAG: radical SAM family heme chaperone HemW [Acidithiobacillus sp.]|nr:radical SAM family heme chaperone HemW [Acidithiobacillus sp.]